MLWRRRMSRKPSWKLFQRKLQGRKSQQTALSRSWYADQGMREVPLLGLLLKQTFSIAVVRLPGLKGWAG